MLLPTGGQPRAQAPCSELPSDIHLLRWEVPQPSRKPAALAPLGPQRSSPDFGRQSIIDKPSAQPF